jgi:hypothetical protein
VVVLGVNGAQIKHRWEKTPMWEAPMDGGESRIGRVAGNSERNFFVRGVTGVAEP